MKFTMRFDARLGEHDRVTVFVDGASAGELVLRHEEAVMLDAIFQDTAKRVVAKHYGHLPPPYQSNEAKN